MFSSILALAMLTMADDPKPHLPTPPCPNCQCGCTETGKCNCKDCDHPQLTKTKTDAPKAPEAPPAKVYTWKYDPAIPGQDSLYDGEKFVGALRTADGTFLFCYGDKWAEGKCPCDKPSWRTAAQTYYTTPFGSCGAGGCSSCGSGSAGGRRR
jgi:hypothetical protein